MCIRDRPNVELRTPSGEAESLDAIIAGKPTVLIFYRGGWCPYCNTPLKELNDIESNLSELGYQIIAISPDAPEQLAATVDKTEVAYQLYSDSKLAASDAFGITFTLDQKTLDKYKKYKIDLGVASGGDNVDRLPVPAVFILTSEGKISFQYVSPDYRSRIPGKLLLTAAQTSLDFQK